ncbi:MAG: HAD family hydrolase [Nevskiales bacterium]|nr:HAD family hydrolase [Nevskiales bacterium]
MSRPGATAGNGVQPAWPHPLKAIIFDVDGTLAETEELHREAFNASFVEAGLDWHWSQDDYRALLRVTGGKERIRHYLQTTRRPGARTPPGAGNDWVQDLHRRKTRRYVELLRSGSIALRPGVRAWLDACRERGLLLAIATTTSPDNVDGLLRHTLGDDGPGRFACIAAGDMVAAKKPAPDVYHAVLDALQLPPAACLAIEDSTAGLRSARAAGIATLVTPSLYTQGQDFDGALAVVPTLDHVDLPMRPA